MKRSKGGIATRGAIGGAHVDPDSVLVALQLHLNTLPPGAEIGVTLNLPGTCVSGSMVSAETWAQAVASLADSGPEAGTPSEVGRYLSQLAIPWSESRARWEQAPDGDVGPFELPLFIHLVGAKFLSGGALVPADGVPWRGRLSQVAGWSYGVIVQG